MSLPAADYLVKHKVFNLFHDMMSDLLVSQPSKPLSHLSAELDKRTTTEVVPRVVLFGAPGAGKGTQAELMQDEFPMIHISTGDMLRAEISKGSELGKVAERLINDGNFVPDELITQVVCDRLREADCINNGYILDGFPRTKMQARAIKEKGLIPNKAIFISVPDDEIVERIVHRRIDPETHKIYHLKSNPPADEAVLARLVHRKDDTEEIVRHRLAVYHKTVNSVREELKYCTRIFDGMKSPKSLYDEIRNYILEDPIQTQPVLHRAQEE